MDKEQIRSNPPANMSPKEAAIYLGISERKLRNDIAIGLIPHVKLGGRIIIQLKKLEQLLEELSYG